MGRAKPACMGVRLSAGAIINGEYHKTLSTRYTSTLDTVILSRSDFIIGTSTTMTRTVQKWPARIVPPRSRRDRRTNDEEDIDPSEISRARSGWDGHSYDRPNKSSAIINCWKEEEHSLQGFDHPFGSVYSLLSLRFCCFLPVDRAIHLILVRVRHEV